MTRNNHFLYVFIQRNNNNKKKKKKKKKNVKFSTIFASMKKISNINFHESAKREFLSS